MAILEQLGINHTYFFQLAIFIVTLGILAQLVFKPYLELLDKRQSKTKGAEDFAADIKKKTADLNVSYENKARDVNAKIKSIFDSARAVATKEYDAIVNKARQQAHASIESNRSKIEKELEAAKLKIKEEAPLIAQTITQKLLLENERSRQ